jgi:hypothetical protein
MRCSCFSPRAGIPDWRSLQPQSGTNRPAAGFESRFCGVEFLMRKSGWTPSIVPNSDGQNVYLVVDDLGRLGRVWREADYERTDQEAVIRDLLAAEYSNPIGVFGFNPYEGWSRDVSADVAQELRRRWRPQSTKCRAASDGFMR